MKECRNQGKRIKVKVTNTEISNSFIKIKVQYVNSDEFIALLDLKSMYKSVDDINNDDIKLGDNVYIARLDFDNYARCRIVEINDYSQLATIELIDSGFKIKINYNQLRILPKSSKLYSMQSINTEYILAELIISRDVDDYRQKFNKFNELVVNKFLDMEILNQDNAGKYVQLYSLEASIAHDIIPNHPTLKSILKRIHLGEQMSLMLEQYINESPDKLLDVQKSPKSKELGEYCTLEEFPPGYRYEVRISAYENGPHLFYVQATDSLIKYQEFHVNLQKITLQSLDSTPTVSDVCLAFLESNNIQRVEIVEIKNDLYKVRLIDHGFERMVKLSDLYEMPCNVRHKKPFAWKFSLRDIDKLHYMNNMELNFYFQYITLDKRLFMRTQERRHGICTLFDDSTHIIDMLKAFNPRTMRYPPKAPLSGQHKVKVVYADSPSLLYVNLLEALSSNQDVLNEFSRFNSCLYRNPSPGSACCVKINNRNCRGTFVNKLTRSICQIKLIDVGIVEDFSCNEIKIMVEKFVKIPPMAYKCCLIEFEHTECDSGLLKNFIMKCKQSSSLNMTVVRTAGDMCYVKLETEAGKNIADELLSNNDTSSVISIDDESRLDENGNNEKTVNINCYLKTPELWRSPSLQDWTTEERKEYGDYKFWDSSINESLIEIENFNTKGIITSIITPTDFTIQCSDTLEKIEKFLSELQEKAPDECPLTTFVESTICAAKNPLTKKWCRAVIIDSVIDESNTLVTVRDVDNGQIFSIETLADLKKLTLISYMSQIYGIRCGLPIKIKSNVEDEATRLFCELTNKEIHYKIIACNQYINVCEIIHNGQQISDYLVNMGVATKLKIIPNAPAFIVYVKSLREFYVHLKHESELVNNMAMYTLSYEHVQLKAPVIDLIVMAKSKEFNKYFRARIKSIDGDEIEVKYLDFGNIEKVPKSNIGIINEPWVLKSSPLAYQCSLNLPKTVDPDTPKAVEHFRNLAKNGFTEIVLRMTEAKLHSSVVEAYTIEGEKNILDDLLPLCDQLEVTNQNISELDFETTDSSMASN